MKVFNCILGIFSILGSVYCIFYPGLSFLNSGWIVTVLLGAWGICAIFDYFSNPNENEKSKSKAAMGALGLVAGIAAAVTSVLAMFIPGIRLIFDVIILCVFSGWLVISGIMSIVQSIKASKAASSKAWIFTLILGILVLITGILGFFNIIIMAQTIGLLIGILLMTYGIRLVCSVFEK